MSNKYLYYKEGGSDTLFLKGGITLYKISDHERTDFLKEHPKAELIPEALYKMFITSADTIDQCDVAKTSPRYKTN